MTSIISWMRAGVGRLEAAEVAEAGVVDQDVAGEAVERPAAQRLQQPRDLRRLRQVGRDGVDVQVGVGGDEEVLERVEPVLAPGGKHDAAHAHVGELHGEFLAESRGSACDEDGLVAKGAHTPDLSVWTWMACKISFPTTRSETTTMESPGRM
ncbi:MAG: hypothetical protein WDO13_03570 [Verrucomicrobiota bacterium]